MTAGTGGGGGDPRTFAIGEAFHRGRAWIGISPPVPVPKALPCRSPTGVLDRGV